MKTTLNTLINIIQVPRGRFLINKCESTLDIHWSNQQVCTLEHWLIVRSQEAVILSTSVKTTLNTLILVSKVPRDRFLINKYESTLDALINSNQVPRGCFLINKCGNNSKYIDKEYPGTRRLFSYQQVWKQL